MNGDVVIEFAFKTLRNFTGALFHSNNLFSSGVEVFQGVDVQYGIDVLSSLEPLSDALVEQRRRDALSRSGRQVTSAELTGAAISSELSQYHSYLSQLTNHQNQQTLWSSDPLSIEYEPDKKVESARPVTVHLKQRLANRLRFVLKFASKWVLVSEIEFLSHPVELLSLQSVSEQQTTPIIEALAPARSYDEYVAILREHQLRRIATNAYFESVTNGAGGISSTSATQVGYDQADDEPAEQHQPNLSPAVYQSGPNLLNSPPQINSAAIDQARSQLIGAHSPYQDFFGKRPLWQPDLSPKQQPATNPLLSGSFPIPSLFSPPASNYLNQQEAPITSSNSGGASEANGNGSMFEQRGPPSLRTPQNHIGLATVISLVFVLALVLLAAVFVASRYKLHRQQPKLGFPSVPFGGVISGSRNESPIKGLVSPFMGVFSESNGNQLSLNSGQHSIYHNSAADYNTIFASRPAANLNHQGAMRNTLGRLASLGGHKHGNIFSDQQHQQQQQVNPGSQLLVSVKDNRSQMFGGHSKAGTSQQSVRTQLIVGLNQANPLAQQQIYNSSNMNCSNQSYTTHYTGSTSMASSSTTNHGDYNEYAIPDVNTMSRAPMRPNIAGDLLRSSCRAQSQFKPL